MPGQATQCSKSPASMVTSIARLSSSRLCRILTAHAYLALSGPLHMPLVVPSTTTSQPPLLFSLPKLRPSRDAEDDGLILRARQPPAAPGQSLVCRHLSAHHAVARCHCFLSKHLAYERISAATWGEL
jgi:hypothetical protein